MKFRIETDSLGSVNVPKDVLYGAQTARSIVNFKIGQDRFSHDFIRFLAMIKKAAAMTNHELKCLSSVKARLIIRACDEIIDGKHSCQFPLVIWQTGSGTQTNMNINEVIANRAIQFAKGKIGSKTPVHPNDDVNKGQSSNDVIPTAMHLAAISAMTTQLIPSVQKLQKALLQKSIQFKKIVKVGRTHLMDAAPVTLGQEFFSYAYQLKHRIEALHFSLKHLREVAIGATAVGTGLNTHSNFKKNIIKKISKMTGIALKPAGSPLAAIASHDALVELSGALKTLAVSLTKISNDIRWLASGPRCGLGELVLPENEPGSSIMPGKVNPTQCEAMIMVCAQTIGSDVTVNLSGTNGTFELNTSKPVMIDHILKSITLLSDACVSFTDYCVLGIKANVKVIKKNLEKSLMLATALNSKIGYDQAAKVVQKAFAEEKTLRQAAVELGFVTARQFDAIVQPQKMINNEED